MVRFEEVFVMGKTILYVHIPDRINVSAHLQQYVRGQRTRRRQLLHRLNLSLSCSDADAAPERDHVHAIEARVVAHVLATERQWGFQWCTVQDLLPLGLAIIQEANVERLPLEAEVSVHSAGRSWATRRP